MNELFMPLPYTGKMFKNDMVMQYVVPLIDSYDDSICYKGYDYPGLSINLKHLYCEYNIRIFQKYLYKTSGSFNIRMLMEMSKRPCSYHEIYNIFLKPRGKPFGNDMTLFRAINANGLCKIHSIGKYKRKFYVPTDFGNLVLDIVKKNDVAYKVLRHYMKGIDDFEAYALTVDLDPSTMDDLSPKSFVKMLDAIFNEDSDLHKIGSYSYWGEKLVSCVKNNENCFNMTNDPEVKAWLFSNMSNPSVAFFSKILSKIAKKREMLTQAA